MGGLGGLVRLGMLGSFWVNDGDELCWFLEESYSIEGRSCLYSYDLKNTVILSRGPVDVVGVRGLGGCGRIRWLGLSRGVGELSSE